MDDKPHALARRNSAQPLKLIRHSLIGGLILLSAINAHAIQVAFVYSSGTFQTYSYPAAENTRAYDINNSGQIVGSFGVGGPAQAYLLSNNTFTVLDPSGVGAYAEAFGINDHGVVVGRFGDGQFTHSFQYKDGAYGEVNVPNANANSTSVIGINNAGQMSGYYEDATGNHGFIGDTEQFTTIHVPGSVWTVGAGLNDLGQVVGRYGNGRGGESGFVYTDGSYRSFDVAGSNYLHPSAINNAGVISGDYFGNDGVAHPFILSDLGITNLDLPPMHLGDVVFRRHAAGINDAGQVVGHFEEEPPLPVPEPQTLSLLLAGLLGLMLSRRKRGVA